MSELPARTEADATDIARLMLPIIGGAPGRALLIRCIRTMAEAHEAIEALLENSHQSPEIKADQARMAYLCRQIVAEPALVEIMERIAPHGVAQPGDHT